MALRLHANNTNEYDLIGSLTAEMIDIYGVEVDYLIMENREIDRLMGDIVSKFTDSALKVIMYPANPEGVMDARGDLLNKFGLFSNDSIDFYVSASSMDRITDDFTKCYGDLVRLPSGKFLEVISVEHQVQGGNNNYVYGVKKNVYLLKCKTYQYNHDELPDMPSGDYDKGLDEVFGIIGGNEEKPSQDMVRELQVSESPIDKKSNHDPLGGLWD